MQDPGEIRVWPGTIFETEDRRNLTITLSQWNGEAWQDFLQRVDAICNYAVSLTPKSEPVTIDLSDTSRYRKINEYSCEVLTPGSESAEEKPTSERDSHFAGFAELLYTALAKLFINQWSYRVTGEEEKADLVKYSIRDLITQRAYDLVLTSLDPESIAALGKTPEEVIREFISDMTEWPE